jgi:hypothetical protein
MAPKLGTEVHDDCARLASIHLAKLTRLQAMRRVIEEGALEGVRPSETKLLILTLIGDAIALRRALARSSNEAAIALGIISEVCAATVDTTKEHVGERLPVRLRLVELPSERRPTKSESAPLFQAESHLLRRVDQTREMRAMPREFVWSEPPDAVHERQPWGLPSVEPPLCDVLADPIIRARMQSDGVTSTALESIIIDAQRRNLRSPARRERQAEPVWGTNMAPSRAHRVVPRRMT